MDTGPELDCPIPLILRLLGGDCVREEPDCPGKLLTLSATDSAEVPDPELVLMPVLDPEVTFESAIEPAPDADDSPPRNSPLAPPPEPPPAPPLQFSSHLPSTIGAPQDTHAECVVFDLRGSPTD